VVADVDDDVDVDGVVAVTDAAKSTTANSITVPHCKTMLGKRRFSVAAPSVWNSLPLNLRTYYNSLLGFKTNLIPPYSARTIFSQCHAAPQITVI